MLRHQISSRPPIHKLVSFNQPPYVFTFYDRGFEIIRVALSHHQDSAAGSRANIQAFLLGQTRATAQDQDHARMYLHT